MNRARIEALWSESPGLTQEQVRRRTGAPKATVRHVYAQLVAGGRLVPRRRGWTAVDAAGVDPVFP